MPSAWQASTIASSRSAWTRRRASVNASAGMADPEILWGTMLWGDQEVTAGRLLEPPVSGEVDDCRGVGFGGDLLREPVESL
jgi:hypothetical protein